MTKIRNTKKGMAKKTLSISLAVAMLATSNVPVWAAEDLFTDGDVAVEAFDAADVFTAEEADAPVVEAPVVEEVAEVPEAQTAEDYTVETSRVLKSIDWDSALQFGSDSEAFKVYDKNGVEKPVEKVELWIGDSMKEVKAVSGKRIADAIASFQKVGLENYKKYGVASVKFYVNGENEAIYTATTAVNPVDISDWTISDYSDTTTVYNGQIQEPDVTVLDNHGNSHRPNRPNGVSDKAVVIRFENDVYAKNVGTYNFTVEGVEEYGYTGEIENGKWWKEFVITPANVTKDTVKVEISGDATYNGKATMPTVVVTDLLAGVEIPSYLYTVSIKSNNVGTYSNDSVTVTFKKTAQPTKDAAYVDNNFKDVVVPDNCKKGSYVISALDLSKLTEKYDVVISTKKVNTNVEAKDITFVDKATGKEYPSTDIIPYENGKFEQVAIKTLNNASAGKGTVILEALHSTDRNVVGTLTAEFNVVENIVTVDDVYFPAGTTVDKTAYTAKKSLGAADNDIKSVLNKIVYNESAQEPLKEAFSNLIIRTSTVTDQNLVLGEDYDIVYTNNTDSSAVSGKQAKVSLIFKGNYNGTISYSFNIQKAEALVTGKDIEFVHGKKSYEALAEVVIKGTSTAVPETSYTVTPLSYAQGNGITLPTGVAESYVVFDNENYDVFYDGKTANGSKRTVTSKIVKRDIANCTASVEGDYVYSGDTVEPKLVITDTTDGNYVLVKGVDYIVESKEGTNAGVAHIVVSGIGVYQGRLTADYTITKADMANATVLSGKTAKGQETNYDVAYTGIAMEPDVATVKIGKKTLTKYDPVTKKGDYILTWDLDAVEVGTYNFTITAVPGSQNVEGTFAGTFKVVPSTLNGYFAEKLDTSKEAGRTPLSTDKTGAFYTGEAITIDSFKTKYVVVDNNGTDNKKDDDRVLTEGKDYRLEYKDNVNAGIASVTAYGIGNYAAVDSNGVEHPIAAMNFYIGGKGTIQTNWVQKIADVEYAGGLAVEPEVVVVDPKTGNRLVQGRDYTVTSAVTEIGEDYDFSDIAIKGNGAYTTADKNNNPLEADRNTWKLTWDVTKKDIANTDITVAGGKVIVMNGSVVVPAGEYDAVFSEDGATVTVTAKESSKYYKGSKEVLVDAEVVGKPMISEVKVVGNKVTVILSGEVDNAVGYDYVLSTEEDYKNGRLVNGINKNQIKTETLYQYIQKGTYYAYCHAWKRDENGKKIFGDWSNLYEFNVTATTPDQPVITSITRKGSDVTVTYTKTANADGYDIVLGTELRTVYGEKRPVEYGPLVKKNVKGNTVTFKDVPEGTYYVGLHAYNRTSLDNKKVFSPWSNSKKVTVK